MCEIRVFVTNLGAYNSGRLLGEWAELPINDDDLDALMHRIGVVKDYSPVPAGCRSRRRHGRGETSSRIEKCAEACA